MSFRQFIDLARVRAVIINEGITLCRVVYYLALVVEGRQDLVVAFQVRKGGGGGGDRRGVGRDKEEGGGSPQSNPTTTQHLQPRLEELLPVYHSTKAVLDASRERQPQDHQDRG